jgi:hypothetical protein
MPATFQLLVSAQVTEIYDLEEKSVGSLSYGLVFLFKWSPDDDGRPVMDATLLPGTVLKNWDQVAYSVLTKSFVSTCRYMFRSIFRKTDSNERMRDTSDSISSSQFAGDCARYDPFCNLNRLRCDPSPIVYRFCLFILRSAA